MATILGIDPGTHRLGWGIISGTPTKPTYLLSGCLENPPHTTPAEYLPIIYDTISTLIAEYHPDVIGLESLLFQKNVNTAIPVAEARGILRLLAARANLPVLEFAPNTIKLTVAGSGSAKKPEVSRMVGLLLGLNPAGKRDDELDALAVALTTSANMHHAKYLIQAT